MTSSPDASDASAEPTNASARPSIRLALIGRHIDSSLAPAFHTHAGQMLGLDVSYELIPREPSFSSQLNGLLAQLGEAGYRGVNITVPFKAEAAQAAVELSDGVASIGVAHTLLPPRTGWPHARVQHRRLRVQVGVPPTVRNGVAGFCRAAGRRRGRHRNGFSARRSRR
jgi:hypothetical protein